MRIKDIAERAFFGGEWFVGYRAIGEKTYHLIRTKPGTWMADPFLYAYEGMQYLFAEYVDGHKGEIACYTFQQGIPVFRGIALSEPYHLSYPCVFRSHGQHYMIPESADHHTVDLYIARDFPDRWEKAGTLFEGTYFDTTWFQYRGREYLAAYRKKGRCWALEIFRFDANAKSAGKVSEVIYSANVGRPAGGFFLEGGDWMRPAQDCSRKYGERIIYYRVSWEEEGEYRETKERVTEIRDIMDTTEFKRVHTYNRSDDYEAVDMFMRRFQLIRPIRLMRKKWEQQAWHCSED